MIVENPQAKSILVVDDEKSFTELIKKVLTQRDYDVMTAANGEEALAVIAKQKPDLILLDINMPKMGGLAFYDRISLPNCQPMYPVLVITASEHLEELFQSLPVEGFLIKPVKIEELLEKVKAVFEKNKAAGSGAGESGRATKKVLIVDNNPDTLKEFSLGMLNIGCLVGNAKNAAEAIARIADPDLPDLILIRQGMPQEPEYTISYHLRGIPAARRVIVVIYTDDVKLLDPQTEKEIIQFVGKKNLLDIKDKEYFLKSCERILNQKSTETSS